MAATTTTRKTAEERREALVEAASLEFARSGLHGASTDDIARRAGISQPYLFRLFRTKKELFLAVVDRCFTDTAAIFREAAEGVEPAGRLEAMGMAYCELLRDRSRLMMQMQTYAACDDQDVRDSVRRHYGDLVRLVEEISGASQEAVSAWFATGMLLNVAAAMDLAGVDEGWVKRLLGDKLLPAR
jgi:AcrR family transcriptional regulator